MNAIGKLATKESNESLDRIEKSDFEEIIATTLVSSSLSDRIQPNSVEADFYNENLLSFNNTPELTRIVDFLNDEFKEEFKNPNVTHHLIEEDSIIYELNDNEKIIFENIVKKAKEKYNLIVMKKNAFINFLQNQYKNTNNCCVPFVIRKKNSPSISNTDSNDENIEELCFSLISNDLGKQRRTATPQQRCAIISHFFLTFFFFIYVMEWRNVSVMERHNVVLGDTLETTNKKNENQEQNFNLYVDYDVCKELAKEGKRRFF